MGLSCQCNVGDGLVFDTTCMKLVLGPSTETSTLPDLGPHQRSDAAGARQADSSRDEMSHRTNTPIVIP